MQNHMTEMLAATAMELPAAGGSSINEIHKLKLELLSTVRIYVVNYDVVCGTPEFDQLAVRHEQIKM